MIIALLLSLAVQDASAAATPAPKKEAKICRKSLETGSRMGGRVCRTRAEWAKDDAATVELNRETLGTSYGRQNGGRTN